MAVEHQLARLPGQRRRLREKRLNVFPDLPVARMQFDPTQLPRLRIQQQLGFQSGVRLSAQMQIAQHLDPAKAPHRTDPLHLQIPNRACVVDVDPAHPRIEQLYLAHTPQLLEKIARRRLG